ncbi:hypothetical protein [Diplocloster agilis]|uniref:YkvI family membrane protein n=1 Tax=Diplocloster agilis TaxID=2850323 RepID=UPI0008218796|nr:hypothetical protein [Suonthocola fibrivorans]MCU6732939.1 hypothetical protein [Suonthocola fibrivorans]SCI67525.1 Uncharacterized membrane protein [uncultured Clostridium sp.]
MRKRNGYFKIIIKYSGALIAFLIGSGFASGQEVLQFFSAYGPVGSLGAGALACLLLFWAFRTVLRDVQIWNLENTNQIYRRYCGRILGGIFEWLTPIFLFLLYVVMLSGAGALLEENYGLPVWTGRFLMLGLTLFTVLLGLDRLVDIIGKIGPVIIICVVCMGIACLIQKPVSIPLMYEKMSGLPLTRAAGTWWLSGLSYASFNIMTILPFLTGIGQKLPDRKTSRYCAAGSSLSFMMAAMILNFGMLGSIDLVCGRNIPALVIAGQWFRGASAVFTLMMFAGIYTTAVPMLWSSGSRVYPDDKSNGFRWTVLILAVAAFFGGSLPFARLVNLIYPCMGYLGFLVLAGMLASDIRLLLKVKQKHVPR